MDVDDAFAAAVEFENGAIGTLEATRMAAGRKNYNCLEINAEKGSQRFNGWEHSFVHQIYHLLDAIANNKPVEPYCATFEDGYKAAVIVDALQRSAEIGEFIDLNY